MEFKWMTPNPASTGGHLQCSFCWYQCKSNSTYQIHIGTSHPFHCEEMDVGRLGKIIFYQKSAKLFHCHECFFTGKSYARVYDHVLVSHSFSRKDKSCGNGDPKDYLSDSIDGKDIDSKDIDGKDIADNENKDKERPEGGTFEAKPQDTACLQAPAKFAALNSAKNEETELSDEDSQHSSSPSQPLKQKRDAASDKEAPPEPLKQKRDAASDDEASPDPLKQKRDATSDEEAHPDPLKRKSEAASDKEAPPEPLKQKRDAASDDEASPDPLKQKRDATSDEEAHPDPLKRKSEAASDEEVHPDPLKRKRDAASDEEAPPDSEDFSDFPGKPELDTDKTREEKQAEQTLLSKYFRRIGGRYYCNICNWRGKMNGFLFHHISKKHNIPRPFACKECSKTFLLESMLLSHVSMFHKQGIYQCPYCAFKSNYIRGVRRHLNNCNAKQGEWSCDSDEQD